MIILTSRSNSPALLTLLWKTPFKTPSAKAGKTLHNIHWFQVVDTRGYVANNKVDYWQVTIKLGFRLDD